MDSLTNPITGNKHALQIEDDCDAPNPKKIRVGSVPSADSDCKVTDHYGFGHLVEPTTGMARLSSVIIKDLNTNKNVRDSLSWDLSHAIRELLMNCFDEDPDSTIFPKDNDPELGEWILINKKIRDGRPGLCIDSFEYRHDPSKIHDTDSSGKFGYGLKDAIAILTAHGIVYTAISPHGEFTALSLDIDQGSIKLAIDESRTITSGARQRIYISDQIKLTPKELKDAVKDAKHDCLQFRDDIIKLMTPVRVPNIDGKLIGTIYYSQPTSFDSLKVYDIIFFHGLAFKFEKSRETADKKQRPLFVYNLNTDKKTLRSRDRDQMPSTWHTDLLNLLLKCIDKSVWDILEGYSGRANEDKIYELGVIKIMRQIESRKIAREDEQRMARDEH